jgi:hypothetical protein
MLVACRLRAWSSRTAAGCPSEGDLAAIRKALEDAGVIFIDANREGEGVRRRKMKER